MKHAQQGLSKHQVRIIGGQWKRTPLTVLNAEGLRPTPDRVRETVFNWLDHQIHGQWQTLACLDLFAGSGALGFEAGSRGAASVLMNEWVSAVHAQLVRTKEKLSATNIEIRRADALALVKLLLNQKSSFNLIFLDPPFHQNLLEKLLPACRSLLAPQGLLYVEAEYALPFNDEAGSSEAEVSWCAGWQLVRCDKAGSVFYHLLQAKVLENEEQNLG